MPDNAGRMPDEAAAAMNAGTHESLVLNVDDNDGARYAKSRILTRAGLRVIEAASGGEALQAAQQHHPDLVLLDMKLPKLSGLDVLRAVRSNPLTALVPVVMLTSSSEQSDIVACYKSGANGFVRKPVDYGDLTEKLNRLQAYWLDVNESIATV